jgi:hypothetical protein
MKAYSVQTWPNLTMSSIAVLNDDRDALRSPSVTSIRRVMDGKFGTDQGFRCSHGMDVSMWLQKDTITLLVSIIQPREWRGSVNALLHLSVCPECVKFGCRPLRFLIIAGLKNAVADMWKNVSQACLKNDIVVYDANAFLQDRGNGTTIILPKDLTQYSTLSSSFSPDTSSTPATMDTIEIAESETIRRLNQEHEAILDVYNRVGGKFPEASILQAQLLELSRKREVELDKCTNVVIERKMHRDIVQEYIDTRLQINAKATNTSSLSVTCLTEDFTRWIKQTGKGIIPPVTTLTKLLRQRGVVGTDQPYPMYCGVTLN